MTLYLFFVGSHSRTNDDVQLWKVCVMPMLQEDEANVALSEYVSGWWRAKRKLAVEPHSVKEKLELETTSHHSSGTDDNGMRARWHKAQRLMWHVNKHGPVSLQPGLKRTTQNTVIFQYFTLRSRFH